MKKLMTIALALAFAGTATADDKKPDAGKKAPEAKKEEPKKEAPKMEAPKPAQEVTDMAKAMAGTWNCSGKFLADPTKGAWTEFKGTNKMTTDLDKFWIKGEGTMTAGPMKMKMTEYMTYDAGQKKWFRLALNSMGGHETGWSADGKAWEGEESMMGMSAKVKAKVEMGAKELKVASESSMDGKKWASTFEMSCKK